MTTEHQTSRRTVLGLLSAAAVPTAALMLPGGAHAAPAGAGGLPDYLPIPSGSAGPELNADGYHVGRIKDELYWVTDGFYQAMLLSTREGVVLVDAPPTIGHNLLRAVQDVTRANGRPGRVTHLVYSHSHADHIGAAVLFGRRVERVAHVETKRLLRAAGDPNRPLPTVTFEDRHVLRVGGERLELAYHGPNHSPDNIFVHAPAHATLMVVDVLYPGWVPFKNLAVSQDIPGWTDAQRRAMQYPWTTLVGGHLGRLGTRADGDLQRQYVIDLEASARATLAALDPAPFFGKYLPAGNAWAIFKTYLEEAARRTAEPVAAKYAGVLAAADVFTVDNAFAMLESLRIDAGVLGPFSIRP
ncbi:MBL fold metallo-hydrolase [Dactylosporangium maewongense]|uniref:MBL fold metallo-hydrolase n=1 Tax=Dactylosporangium maewongense TaxID=634393 RepID=A0ABP4N115_9ACTN